MVRRFIALAVVGLSIVCAVPTSKAENKGSLSHELETGSDYRVRVAAALALGKSGDKSARAPLEKALGDQHPAVRVAAAAALGALGDSAAIPALKAAITHENAANVRTQIERTVVRLSSFTTITKTGGKARFLVALGRMDDKSGTNTPALTSHFEKSTRFQMAMLPGAEVIADDTDMGAESKARHLPIFTLDGALMKLAKGSTGTEVTFSAKVEFLIRRVPDQSIKGTVTGMAEALADARSVKGERELVQLQRDAVSAAVESAMKGAPPALEAATK